MSVDGRQRSPAAAQCSEQVHLPVRDARIGFRKVGLGFGERPLHVEQGEAIDAAFPLLRTDDGDGAFRFVTCDADGRAAIKFVGVVGQGRFGLAEGSKHRAIEVCQRLPRVGFRSVDGRAGMSLVGKRPGQ